MGIFQNETAVVDQSEQPELVPQLQTSPPKTSDTDLAEELRKLKQLYEKLKDENITLTTEIAKVKAKNSEINSKFKDERQKRYDAENKADRLQTIVDSQQAGNVPKKTSDLIVRERLKDKLTESQLDGLLKDIKKSRKYTDKDFAYAEQIRSRVANHIMQISQLKSRPLG